MRGQGSAEEESGEDQEEVLGLVQRGWSHTPLILCWKDHLFTESLVTLKSVPGKSGMWEVGIFGGPASGF